MKTLFLQFRENKNIINHERLCILNGIRGEITSRNVFLDELDFLNKNDFTHIILGGSGEFSIFGKDKNIKNWKKIEKVIPFLKKSIERDVKMFGICLGHQLIAFSLGSKIKKDKDQKEVGTYKVYLTSNGKKDGIFKDSGSSFFAHQGHQDSVLKLPKGAVLLATGRRCKIQSFRFKNAIGVQFHPELNTEELTSRISLYFKGALEKKGKKTIIKESTLKSNLINNFYKN